MATCGYLSMLEVPADPVPKTIKNVQCVPLSDCRGDVGVHLKTLHVWDASLKTEAQLLVAGAGIV